MIIVLINLAFSKRTILVLWNYGGCHGCCNSRSLKLPFTGMARDLQEGGADLLHGLLLEGLSLVQLGLRLLPYMLGIGKLPLSQLDLALGLSPGFLSVGLLGYCHLQLLARLLFDNGGLVRGA